MFSKKDDGPFACIPDMNGDGKHDMQDVFILEELQREEDEDRCKATPLRGDDDEWGYPDDVESDDEE